MTFGVAAQDGAGHTGDSEIRVLIINSGNIASFTVSKSKPQVETSINTFTRYDLSYNFYSTL